MIWNCILRCFAILVYFLRRKHNHASKYINPAFQILGIKIEKYQLFVWETNQLFKPAPPWSAILLLRWTNYRETSRSFVNLICTAGLHPRPLQGKAGEREEKYRSLTVGGKDICAKYHLRLRRLSMKSESAFLLQCMHAEN